MAFKRERQGELFISSAAALWGLFPIVTIASYGVLSPLASLAGNSLFAALFRRCASYGDATEKRSVNSD